MKITIQDKERRAEIECSLEDIHSVVDELCNLLIAWGFHPESVKEGILGKGEEYEERKRYI